MVAENNAEYKFVSLKMGLFYISSLFGKKADEDDYLEQALLCLKKIGNVYKTVVRYDAKTDENGYLCLPSEAYTIEAVSVGNYDWDAYSYRNTVSSIYPVGRFLPYSFDGRGIKTDTKEQGVSVIYRTFIADEEGYPMVTEQEAEACAYWWMWIDTRRRTYKGEQLASSLLQMVEKDKNKALLQARCELKFSQNFLDQYANALYSQDRKIYGHSFKPVKLK